MNQWSLKKSIPLRTKNFNFLFGMKSTIFMFVKTHKFIFIQLKIKTKVLHMTLAVNLLETVSLILY